MTKTSNLTRGLSVRGKTRETVHLFLSNIMDRKFTDAERALEQIANRKFTNQEFKEGYTKALEGILLSARSGDDRDFYNKAEHTTEELKEYKKEFTSLTKKQIITNFDQGFFSAWSDLTQYWINCNKD